jgi:predicted membrane protein
MKGRYFVAILLILIGLALILDQYNIWSFGELLSTWWPLTIISWGIASIVMNRHNYWSGAIILLIGVLFQADTLDMLPGSAWDFFWPIGLILAGLYLLTNRKTSSKDKLQRQNQKRDNYIKYDTFFSGVKESVEINDFRGGSVQVAFGGIELDLSKCEIAPDGADLEINVSFGGLELFVPKIWKLEISGSPFAGALNNKTRQDVDDSTISPILRIKYSVMFGGIDIRN